MRNCPRYKWIPVEEAKIDHEYHGYKRHSTGNSTCSCLITYKGNGIGWCWDDESRAVDDISFLERGIGWLEQEQWWIDQFDKNNTRHIINTLGLYHDMYDIGDAYHEMWNSWVKVDFWEQIVCIEDEDFTLVGIAPAPWDKDEIFGDGNSCAFVCEDSKGNRFWCHGSWKWVKDMREQGLEVYTEIKTAISNSSL